MDRLLFSPQTLAERVRDAMIEHDAASKALGMLVEAVGPGTARVRMVVRADMVNGFSLCHGGLIATLADTAFALACNSHNEMSVASGLDAEFVQPARLGDTLVAEASELSQSGRLGVYDVIVENQHGERIALVRGRSYRMKGRPVIAEPAGGANDGHR